MLPRKMPLPAAMTESWQRRDYELSERCPRVTTPNKNGDMSCTVNEAIINQHMLAGSAYSQALPIPWPRTRVDRIEQRIASVGLENIKP